MLALSIARCDVVFTGQATGGRPDLVAGGVDGHEVKRPLGQDPRPLLHLQIMVRAIELAVRFDGADEMKVALNAKAQQVLGRIPAVGYQLGLVPGSGWNARRVVAASSGLDANDMPGASHIIRLRYSFQAAG